MPPRSSEQIHARRSDLEQEQAQLSAEHGPSFPRVVEIGRQLQDLDRQKQAEDAKLVERFRSNWQTALDREQLVRKSLEQATSEGMKVNEATTEYAVMRQEANASHDLYVRVLEKSEEAGLAAGVHSSNISVVDAARQPAKPVAPDLPLYLAITFFAGLWIAIGAALLRESLANPAARTAAISAYVAGCRRLSPRAGADAQHFGPAQRGRQHPAIAGDAQRFPIPRKLPRFGTTPAPLEFRRSPPRNLLRPCPRLSLPATFSTSASTTRRNFIPQCASLPPARSRCP